MKKRDIVNCIVLCLLIFFNINPLLSAEVNLKRIGSNNIITYDGPVEKRDLEKLRKIQKKSGYITELQLSSPGGFISEAFEISNFVRNNHVVTRVNRGRTCFSACFDIFIGGIIRIVSDRGKLGSHMHAFPPEKVIKTVKDALPENANLDDILRFSFYEFERASAIVTAKRIRNLIDKGIDYRAIDPLIETHSLSEFYFSNADLKRYNIVNYD